MQVESLGAEARVTSGVFCGKECVVKRRLPKEYRHPVLDNRLRKARTLHEARCLVRSWDTCWDWLSGSEWAFELGLSKAQKSVSLSSAEAE